MPTLTRSITNASSTVPLVLAIPGFDPTSKITIAASATLDLLSVMTADSFHAFQGQVAQLVASGEVTVALTIDSSVIYPAATINNVTSSDTQVVFNPTSASATHIAGATSVLQIENAAGAVDMFDNATTITVTATPGGATTPLINGHASPVTLTVNKGTVSVLITSSGADTITCAMSATSRTLTHSSTFVATLS